MHKKSNGVIVQKKIALTVPDVVLGSHQYGFTLLKNICDNIKVS